MRDLTFTPAHSSAALVIVNWRYIPKYRTAKIGPARIFKCTRVAYRLCVKERNKFIVTRNYKYDDDEIDRKIDVTAIQFLLVQNRQQTHD